MKERLHDFLVLVAEDVDPIEAAKDVGYDWDKTKGALIHQARQVFDIPPVGGPRHTRNRRSLALITEAAKTANLESHVLNFMHGRHEGEYDFEPCCGEVQTLIPTN